jgi:photosynthetic reaction center H subunit
MKIGAITGYIDVAQMVLYVFWIFFFGLVYWLHREDKREGYPLESSRSDRAPRVKVQGFPSLPKPKYFKLMHGGVAKVAGNPDTRPVAGRPFTNVPGSPLVPIGNPMLAGVGPGAYAQRADHADLGVDGLPKIVPLRVAKEYYVDRADPNPIGMPVIAGDGKVGGHVRDVWVDRSEPQVRYFEVEAAANQRRVLVPIGFARVHRDRGCVTVRSVYAQHFADVPGTAHPDQVTLLEEEKISAYYGAGTLYAAPDRAEPLL